MQDIRIGMVGAGQVSKAHALALTSSRMLFGANYRTDLRLIAEATDELARRAQQQLGFRASTSDWRLLAASPDVDLVDIVTPTFLHAEPAIAALEHGKGVLCEKPLSTSSAEAKRMHDAARKAGVVNMVGFNYRRLPAVALCKRMIEAGELGKILQCSCSFMEDWGANPDLPFAWRFRLEKAGAGVLADLGSHVLDLCRFLVGEIRAVCASQARFFDERPLPGGQSGKSDVDDTTMCLVKFDGGAVGRVDASWCAVGRRVGLDFEVTGIEGSVHFNLERANELQVFSRRPGETEREGYKTILMGPLHPYGNGIVFPAPACGMGFEESVVNEVHDLLTAVAEGRSVAPSFYDGWRVNVLMEAIQESARIGAWVSPN